MTDPVDDPPGAIEPFNYPIKTNIASGPFKNSNDNSAIPDRYVGACDVRV